MILQAETGQFTFRKKQKKKEKKASLQSGLRPCLVLKKILQNFGEALQNFL